MPLRFDLNNAKTFLPQEAALECARAAFLRLKEFEQAGEPLGWSTLPKDYDKEEFARIKIASEKIRSLCDVFIVIGIGGSYLGARAAIEFLFGQNYNHRKGMPEIYFSGNSLDADAIAELLEYCRDKDVCINVISKSGTTTEPAVAFRIWRAFLEEKYGHEAARERIFVTTDKNPRPGTLKELSDKEGYESFVVPGDVGGRYSVLTAVGLLPIAVAGADIDAMMNGADLARQAYADCTAENPCVQYALARKALYEGGKEIELFASFCTRLQYFGEWLKQLFGESEGKDGKGLFPASVVYSTDLHSMGQYVQEGERIFFETFLEIEKPNALIPVPFDQTNVDGLNFLAGKDLDEVSDRAQEGTIAAHVEGGVPIFKISLERADEESFGRLVYFFELSCALSGCLIGINPFNQPGVELYKRNMFRLLGKPGYEA